jgi:predicted HicB family RNase H-like nuclease
MTGTRWLMKKTIEYSKNIQLRVTPEFHKQIKLYCINMECTLQDYIESVVRADLRMNGVDKEIV